MISVPGSSALRSRQFPNDREDQTSWQAAKNPEKEFRNNSHKTQQIKQISSKFHKTKIKKQNK